MQAPNDVRSAPGPWALRRAAMRRDQRGASLIEVLVAVGVMVPLTMAGALGLMTAIKVSGATDQQQALEIALTSGTENIKAMPYLPCGTAKEYQQQYVGWAATHGQATDDGIQTRTPVIERVRYWHEQKAEFVDTCSSNTSTQQFRVTVVGTGRSQTGNIVKRDTESIEEVLKR